MRPLLVTDIFLSGLFGFAAVHYAIMWWSARRERMYLSFAQYSAVCALLGSAIAILLVTDSAEVARQAVHLRFSTATLGQIFQVLVISELSGVRARGFERATTGFFLFYAVAFVVLTFSPTPVVTLERSRLPWGELAWGAHARPEAWWLVPVYLGVFAVNGFGLWCAWRMWARDRTGAVLVGIASIATLGTVVVAVAIDLLRQPGTYLGPLPQALWLFLISLQLARQGERTRLRLLESERRARAIFDQTFQFAGLIEPDGRLVEANATAMSFAGVTESDVIGRLFWETPWWTHSRDVQERLRRGIAAAAGGEVDRFETTHLAADGRMHEIDVSLKPVRDEQGKVVHVIAEGRIVTERKEAERALRESEALLRAMSDNLPGSMVYQVVREHDGTMRFQYLSAAVERIHQLKAADVLRDASLIYRQIDERDLARVTAAEQESLRTMRVFDAVTRMRRPDGQVLWVRLTSAPRLLPDGRVAWDGLETDITDRMRADEALRESEERNRLMVEEVKDHAIFMLDPQGAIVTWNVGAERVQGYAADEVIGRNYAMFFTPEDAAAGRPAHGLELALRDGHHIEEGWRVRKDGTRFWMTGSLTALVASDGTLRGFAKVARDKTELKRSESLWRSVVDTTIEGIVTINEKGVIQSFNRAAESIFGWTEREIVGRNLTLLMPEPHRSRHGEYLGRYSETGERRLIGIGAEVLGLRRDGSTFPMELSVGEYSFDQRRYFTGIVRDVTARKALEQQLRQSQKMEAIGQLAGGVAHDFNNLLTVINGYADLLLSHTEGTQALHHDLQQIRQAGERASALTRQLLAFSRQSVMEVRVLSLNAVVTNAEKMLRRVIGEDITLDVRLDATDVRLKADPDQIGQVLLNLAVNARDAMPHGGRLSIETGHVVLDDAYAEANPDFQAGPHVLLTVTDDGSGMTPEVRARIFEPFFTTKEQGKGTGLGLAVAHGIVRQSGGNIEVQSAPGAGTTFRIYLPALRDTDAAPDAGTAEADAAPETGHERVLVVEDEETVRELAVILLRRQGYDVLVAADGNAALRMARETDDPIDLLLTDVLMPGMSGPQLAAGMTAHRPGLRVLFMSGYTPDAMLRHGILEGEVEVLKKPFTAQMLATRVREVLSAPRRAPGARPS